MTYEHGVCQCFYVFSANLSRFLFTSVTHSFFIISKFWSVLAMLVRYVKISLKVKVVENKCRRTSSVKLVHLRGILTSKAKVLYCSLRLNTYSKLTFVFSYMFGEFHVVAGSWYRAFASFRVKFFATIVRDF